MRKITTLILALLLAQTAFADAPERRPGDNHAQNPGRGGQFPVPNPVPAPPRPVPAPNPYPAPNPAPYPGDNRGGDGRIGSRYYNIKRDFREVEIVAYDRSGTITLRFLDNGSIGGGWTMNDLASQQGCAQNFCVGDMAFNSQRDYRLVQVVGIQQATGQFVVRFQDNNGVGGNWNYNDLASTRGCGPQFCVGDRAFNTQRDYREVQVVGIESTGQYVVRFFDNNGVGGRWADKDLAKQSGCGRSLCVGDIAVNNKRNNRQVQVVGIQMSGQYVVRFFDNNGVGGNWNDEDLYRIR